MGDHLCRLIRVGGWKSAPLGRHQLPDRRRHLAGEPLDRHAVVGAEDEAGDAVVEGESGQLLDPLVSGTVEYPVAGHGEPAGDVEQAPHRTWIAPGGSRTLVDVGVEFDEVGRTSGQVSERRQPAVGGPPGQPQHARLVRAEPNADRMGGRRPPLGSVHRVIVAVDANAAGTFRGPDLPDDLDRLLECCHRLTGRESPSTSSRDGIPDGAGAQPQFDPATGEQVQACGAAGHHDRLPEREVEDVSCQRDAIGAGRDIGHQRPGVVVSRLVGVVLEGRQVEADALGQLGQFDRLPSRLIRRGDERAEEKLVPVVHRLQPLLLMCQPS